MTDETKEGAGRAAGASRRWLLAGAGLAALAAGAGLGLWRLPAALVAHGAPEEIRPR